MRKFVRQIDKNRLEVIVKLKMSQSSICSINYYVHGCCKEIL